MLRPALLLLAAPVLSAQSPTFHDGDLAKVSCKVVAANVAFQGSVYCEVEVRNGTAWTCEPAVFALRIGKEHHRIERAPLPYAGRHGRGVAKGGVRRFPLQFTSAADPKSLAVEIVAAAFHDQAPQEAPPVEVGRLRRGTIRDGERTVDATYVGLRSQSDLPADVILLGTFEKPFKGKALLAARLRPRADTEAFWSVQPTMLAWTDLPPGSEGVRLQKVEIVDWTQVEPGALADPAVTQALLQAYERWRRWDEPWPNGEGTFHAVYARSTIRDGTPVTITGRFRLKDVAPPLIDSDAALDLEATKALEAAVDAAFGDLRRPARAEFEQRNKLSVQDRARFLVDGPGWPGQFAKLVEVQEGRIAGLAHPEAVATIWQRWLLQPDGDGYLVVGRDTTQLAVGNQPMETERRTYARQGEWIVPVTYRRATAFGGFHESIDLTLTCGELQRRGAVPPGDPAGPGATALQQAWANGYRYPDAPTPLRARFEIGASSDHVWYGERKVKGAFAMAAFRGFRMDGSGFRREDFTVELDAEGSLRGHLVSAAIDRLHLWAGRDFAGRPAFAQALRGATILDAGDGRFTIANGALEEVAVQGGLVVRLRWRGGQERRIDWQKLGDAMVPVVITTGDEVLTARWKRLDKDWTVPVDLRFERVFGKDWGPETVKLIDVARK